MLHREDPAGLVVITQPTHAWIAGQLAQAWGNTHVGHFEPWADVCLGAEQHDIGWLAWEASPTLNGQTGRPHSFLEMPTLLHVAIWSSAARMALALGRYPALLVSLHGTGLYERYGRTYATADEERAVQEWLAGEYTLQRELIASLQADSHYAPYVTQEMIARNRQLVAVWDMLSLALCMGLDTPHTFDAVPAANGTIALTLTPIADNAQHIHVTPWPFREERVTLVCEGRRLPQHYESEERMRQALLAAPWVTIHVCLHPVAEPGMPVAER